MLVLKLHVAHQAGLGSLTATSKTRAVPAVLPLAARDLLATMSLAPSSLLQAGAPSLTFSTGPSPTTSAC